MAKNDEKYAYLSRLSTKQLEELLRADIESSDESDSDVIFHILEVLEERESEYPAGGLVDEDQAWKEFQNYYNIPEGDGMSLYPTASEEDAECPVDPAEAPLVSGGRRHGGFVRSFVAVAAIIAVLFTGMIVAQASGFDIFGAIGRWTEETFHFIPTKQSDAPAFSAGTESDMNSEHYDTLSAALESCGITEALVPTWYPDGFEASEPKVSKTDYSKNILCGFTNGEDETFSIQVRHYYAPSDMDFVVFEKDRTSMNEYISKEKSFYMMSNVDTITATWSDGTSLILSITGNIPTENIKMMIDSIGGT